MIEIAIGVVGLLSLVFGPSILRIVKIKVFKLALRELDTVGIQTVDDKMDEYMNKVLDAKIPTP